MKYIVKNCPAFCDSTRQCRGAYDRKISHQYCSGNNDDNCIMKQVVRLCEKNQFFNYGAVMLGNGLSTDILDLLEIEEVNE